MRRMQILHVIQRYYPYTGGSELYFQELSERFAADGHQVTVLTTNAWDLDHFWAPGRRTIDEPEALHNGVRILRFPVRRAPGPPIVYPILRRLMVELGRLPRTIPIVRRLSRLTPRVPGLSHYLATTTDRYDLVNSTNITLDFAIQPALAFAQRRGIAHICTPFIHLGEPGSNYILRYYAQPFQIDLLKRSDAVLTQTGLETRFLQSRGVPRQRMVEVGGWVRPETLTGGIGDRFRQAHNLSGPIVLSIGAAAYDKGTMHLIAAMQRLWANGSGAHLVLVSSNLLGQFERFWATLDESTRARITIVKAATHAEKLDALAAAQVFAMPSRTDSFGIVFLEAWMYCLPVVGALAGGVPDVIDDGQNGYLVHFGDVAALAARIGELLDEPGRASRFGESGRAKVLGTMSFETKYKQVLEVYRSLVGSQ
jgi:glycosyltransferase involved in cell wall biosynthesis